jgi:fructose-bisphosphate aldolase class II
VFVLSTDYFQDFFKKKEGYIQTQVGNPEGSDKPNKKVNTFYFRTELVLIRNTQYYDPRVWVREGEKTLSERVKEACTDLGNVSECMP